MNEDHTVRPTCQKPDCAGLVEFVLTSNGAGELTDAGLECIECGALYETLGEHGSPGALVDLTALLAEEQLNPALA